MANIRLAVPWVFFIIVGVVMVTTGLILPTEGVGATMATGLAASILAIGAIVVLFCAIVSSSLNAYVEALIYRYAVGLAVPGIDAALLPARRTTT